MPTINHFGKRVPKRLIMNSVTDLVSTKWILRQCAVSLYLLNAAFVRALLCPRSTISGNVFRSGLSWIVLLTSFRPSEYSGSAQCHCIYWTLRLCARCYAHDQPFRETCSEVAYHEWCCCKPRSSWLELRNNPTPISSRYLEVNLGLISSELPSNDISIWKHWKFSPSVGTK